MKITHDESFGIIPLKKEGEEWKVFLILHKGGKHWGFPKGHLDAGESPLDAAKRELFEETGLQVIEFLRQIPFVEQYQFRTKKQLISKKVHYYPAVVSGDVQFQPEEIQDGKWMTFKDALATLTFKEGKEICNHVVRLLEIPE
jgi:8-oxo-dGTP pyrophosphatase MutT (NUDIX family)